jgi:regulator of protease activity HflC (stomatin/prohibitin superfamily)
LTLEQQDRLEEKRYINWKVIFIILGIVIILFVLVFIPYACVGASAVSPMDKYTLVYQGGPLDGRNFERMVDPGTGRFWKGNLQSIYMYPSTQRTYVVANEPDVGDVKGGDAVVVNCKGGNKVTLEMALSFVMVPENLQRFHEMLGLKYGAWSEEGWDKMLEEQVRQPLETAFQDEAKKYTNIEAINEVGMMQMGDAVAAIIQTRIDAYMNGHYIKVINLSLTTASPESTVQNEIEKISAAQQSVQTAENNRLAAEKNAQANILLRESLQGEGGMTAVLQKAVDSGRITFWVLPSDMNIVGPTSATATPVTPAQ